MRLLAWILVALVFFVPWLFESYTFHLYDIRDPNFFTFSGARTPFFVASLVTLGYFVGANVAKDSRVPYYILACSSAIVVLTLAFYQFCEDRQCYYVGPDGLGEIKLFLLLLSSSMVGFILGRMTNKESQTRTTSSHINLIIHNHTASAFLALFMIALFLSIFPASFVYNVPTPPAFRIFLFAYYVTVPFILAGIVSAKISPKSTKPAIAGSILCQLLLFILLALVPDERQSSVSELTVQLSLVLGFSVLSTFAGITIGSSFYARSINTLHKITEKGMTNVAEVTMAGTPRERRSFLIVVVIMFVSFAFLMMHPTYVAPIDLMPKKGDVSSLDGEEQYLNVLSSIPSPMYYSGAYNNEARVSTKQVEVDLKIVLANQQVGAPNPTRGNEVLLAGIGAQSPNCCKDGLDYGYRTDVLFTSDGRRFLVARAWETCDQNAACSGFPWRSIMHESVVPISNSSSSTSTISLAMEWQGDDKTVNWLYRNNENDNWTKYSSFESPEIENPYFNLGVVSIADPLITSIAGQVTFFQAGIATLTDGPITVFDGSKVIFNCPSYYDKQGLKHCFEPMDVIRNGDTKWKVLWGWGEIRPQTHVEIDNSNHSVTMGIE